MGYLFVFGPCYGCGRMFGYNPTLVPSLTPPDGSEKVPICQTCVNQANPVRIRNGLPPIIPLAGAYDPANEQDVTF
jgi:hypothetical protein